MKKILEIFVAIVLIPVFFIIFLYYHHQVAKKINWGW